MNIASVCMQHEYCNSCPMRKECNRRITFYNEKQFIEILEQANRLSNLFALSIGIPNKIINDYEVIFTKAMNKKRQQELKEHPTYSDF